jgi:hypothetical protein
MSQCASESLARLRRPVTGPAEDGESAEPESTRPETRKLDKFNFKTKKAEIHHSTKLEMSDSQQPEEKSSQSGKSSKARVFIDYGFYLMC